MVKRWFSMVVVALALLAATGCDVFWSSVRFGPGNTGTNDTDTSITTTKVASMQKRFSAPLGVVAPISDIPNPQVLPFAPVTAAGKVLVAAQGHVLGFDQAGVNGCAGSPVTCAPTWTGDYGHATWWTMFGPTVSGNVLYVLAGDPKVPEGGLFAFDLKGVNGCSGTPVVCQPLWRASIVASDAPTVSDGKVFATNVGGRLEVYDAAGVEGCGGDPVVCQPRWTAPTGEGLVPPSKPAVVGGVAYVATRSGTLVASDAAGVVNCSGTPKVCQPLWTAPGTGSFGGVPPAPVVGGGRAYVVHGAPGGAEVAAYDAAGVTGCSGTPITCTPLWRTPVKPAVGFFSQLALTDEYLLVPNAVADLGNPSDTPKGKAFRVDGAGCGPSTCPAAFTWLGGPVTPTVVNHLILVSAGSLYAFDARGIDGCTTNPCSPIATSAAGTVPTSATGLGAANGKVFTISVNTNGVGTLVAAW